MKSLFFLCEIGLLCSKIEDEAQKILKDSKEAFMPKWLELQSFYLFYLSIKKVFYEKRYTLFVFGVF